MLQPLDIDPSPYHISAKLNDPYYDQWENVIANLPRLLEHGIARTTIDRISILSTDRLSSEPMWRRAYVVLSFLAQAYTWGAEVASDTLPLSIVRPLMEVAQYFQVQPCATFAAFCLWNFSVPKSGPEDVETCLAQPDNLSTIASFTGTQDESWFFSISNAIEARGGQIIPPLLNALRAVQSNDLSQLEEFLQEICTSLEEICLTLMRMSEQCEPSVFYHQLRPMLCGSRDVTSIGRPKGVCYPNGGDSNAQSSTIQLFDIILGIHHEAAETEAAFGGSQAKYLEEMRHYMPGPHRKFLELMEEKCNIREFVLIQAHNTEVQRLYRSAVLKLRSVRDAHLSIVSRYVIVPAMREREPRCDPGGDDLTGTGGTEIMSFLRNRRDETDAASRVC
ncbi:indoleamine 2,3-dioxygenase [Aspergillus ibericus CBS 121593]|uniref:Indoleamine 2,3-dioxygenase n=1 Tax=Aspergillus ibericus CBS 121593 TaxID=1448316 RepID=A0A395H8Q6_9EURO|nr:Indoleamine 2,3-dioxygenase [Aspergillus ibericus CBS 121593]RAL02614.1 Indoleamine 2,3-dioxygenase [Aspergillus ibericus CBS 121593]